MSNDPTAESVEQYFENHVFCCMNVRTKGHPRGCCSEKGGVVLRNYMKSRAKELGVKNTRINGAQCLDRCEFGPVLVIYPEGVWYQFRTKEDVDEILQSHLIGGEKVTRLMLRADQVPPKAVEA